MCIFCNEGEPNASICSSCVQKVLALMANNLIDRAIEVATERGYAQKLEYLLSIKGEEKDGEQKRPSDRPTRGFSDRGRVDRNIRRTKERHVRSKV